MESLVATSPESIDVDVLALVNRLTQSVAWVNPPGRAAGRMAPGETKTREPSDAEDGTGGRYVPQPRHVGQQAGGVLAGGLGQDLVGGPGLDHNSAAQHDGRLGHAAHQGQVM